MPQPYVDPDALARCRAVTLANARLNRTEAILRLVTLGQQPEGPALRTVVRALDVLIEKLERSVP